MQYCKRYGIREFTDDPNCLLRLALKRTTTPLRLDDGTRIVPGDPVGELHLWNDHVPRYPPGGPTLGWASRAHSLVVYSLSLLVDYVESDAQWRRVQAFYVDVPISPKRPFDSVRRVSLRYGFEPALQRQTFWRSVRGIIESLLLGGLAYAYNPVATHRRRFLRHRQRAWIGRTTLLQRYGARGP